MDTSKLRIELIISGSFYLLSLLFVSLKILGLSDFSFIPALKDYFLYVSVAILIASYIMGIVGHSLIHIFFIPPARLTQLIFRKKDWLVSDQDVEPEYITLLQYGSTELLDLLASQKRDTNLLKNLIVAVPLSAVGYFVWALNTSSATASWYILILSLIIDIGLLVAYVRQRKFYKYTLSMGYQVVSKFAKGTQAKQKK